MQVYRLRGISHFIEAHKGQGSQDLKNSLTTSRRFIGTESPLPLRLSWNARRAVHRELAVVERHFLVCYVRSKTDVG
jgi:hypothetical protein